MYAWEPPARVSRDISTPGFFYPVYVPTTVKERHVDMLLATNSEGRSHYCWIKNLDKMLGSQGNHKKWYCRYCLHGFTDHYEYLNDAGRRVQRHHSDEYMKTKICDHEKNCFVHKSQRVEFPKHDHISFTNVSRQVNAPFVVCYYNI